MFKSQPVSNSHIIKSQQNSTSQFNSKQSISSKTTSNNKPAEREYLNPLYMPKSRAEKEVEEKFMSLEELSQAKPQSFYNKKKGQSKFRIY